MGQKWIAIVGSARRQGNTDLIVDIVIEALSKKNIKIEKMYLSNNISTCIGCEGCISTGKCNIKDDISIIIDNMKIADGYIFASPSYNYNVTAQMKALLDRTFCLNEYKNGWESRLPAGKKAIIIGDCAGKEEESMGYTIEGISKPLSELGVEIIDVIKYFDTKNNPVINNNDIKEKIINRLKEYV